MRDLRVLIILGLCAPALTACEKAQEQIGLTKQSPDEFAVLRRAPLELPPNYTLRPPAPGAVRPQEQETANEAAQAVFGARQTQDVAPADGEDFLLQQAGAGDANPDIRRVVDSETASIVDADQPVVEKIMNLGDNAPKSSVVDAKAEAERLRQNAEAGKPVTEGETPSKIQ